MKKVLGVTLGILTAIGGFVDIGDLVTNALVGARFGMHMAWVVVVGVIGICLYAEMCGRVVAMSGRPVFDLVRERLGPRTGLLTLVASFLVTLLTLIAEIGGVALALELASGVHYLLWMPLAAFAVWLVIWRVKFSRLEQVFGLLGLLLVVFAVALFKLGPDWGQLLHQATRPHPIGHEDWATYAYYGIALFGAAMTPYEVFFFSSGGVEEKWTRKDLVTARSNVFVGFPLGGLLSLAIMGCAAVLFLPAGIKVETLGQVALPVAVALGKLGLAIVLIGVFAATFGAALETALSCGYTIAQYRGWQWGKFVRPREASRFHVVIIVCLVLAMLTLLTAVDPVQVTEYSVVFAAVALPLTYLPILIVANDPDYVGQEKNGPVRNAVGLVYLALLTVASLAAIPLMIITKGGQ
ncbi:MULTISPECIES: NRAMP family divalent metal transporter [Kribbella]|uniref:Mn2+/Fe2+ NRAMP family transporter n=1 Tax=Kribbella pratensis TaxID=2512112 RepID=A0ABY2FKB5_9ACTN|nr:MULTISPECIES: divalent metal cation transporter [Kribbella]TDW91984.1 Mn2+/Fe2+ NRAMP family transporter [Kribbella sp. VKM Ac-2566]TDW93070.1 Mn2+/Fe2+ NRAMP family transporter [Kribbella pratensis]